MEITLQAITAANWRDVVALRVAPEQESMVAPNYHSLIEAAYGFEGDIAHLTMIPNAIYADSQPVGFSMYNVGPAYDRFYIMRLMIGYQYQGRGYGRAALQQLLALFRAYPQAKEVAISYNLGNAAARDLYLKCGFTPLSAEDAEDQVMWQPLNPQAQPWTSLWKQD